MQWDPATDQVTYIIPPGVEPEAFTYFARRLIEHGIAAQNAENVRGTEAMRDEAAAHVNILAREILTLYLRALGGDVEFLKVA